MIEEEIVQGMTGDLKGITLDLREIIETGIKMIDTLVTKRDLKDQEEMILREEIKEETKIEIINLN